MKHFSRNPSWNNQLTVALSSNNRRHVFSGHAKRGILIVLLLFSTAALVPALDIFFEGGLTFYTYQKSYYIDDEWGNEVEESNTISASAFNLKLGVGWRYAEIAICITPISWYYPALSANFKYPFKVSLVTLSPFIGLGYAGGICYQAGLIADIPVGPVYLYLRPEYQGSFYHNFNVNIGVMYHF